MYYADRAHDEAVNKAIDDWVVWSRGGSFGIGQYVYPDCGVFPRITFDWNLIKGEPDAEF
ncbi:hypothetical protein GCM10022394_10020 [Zobellella aerophila]|uniref:Uncharacterized protein n=1 Tax=Zobellella aerophila TaxID=870480 RepID=A0ABP6VF94_9GAMM